MIEAPSVNKKKQRFGGSWTERKLELLGKYLSAYTIALRYSPTPANPFKPIYIDAFAGKGHCYIKDDLDEIIETAGSARVALEIPRPFFHYYFIEKDGDKLAELAVTIGNNRGQTPNNKIIHQINW